DRLLGVELLGIFRLGLEQLGVDAGGPGRLRDVHQQLRHLGLARQLAQQLAQHVLHVGQLLLQGMQIDGLGLFVGKFPLERGLLADRVRQFVLLIAALEIPAAQDDQGEQTYHEEQLDRARPAADVVAVEVAQVIDETHDSTLPFVAGVACTVTWPDGVAAAGAMLLTAALLAGATLAAAAVAVAASAPAVSCRLAASRLASAGLLRARPRPKEYGVRELSWLFSVFSRSGEPSHGEWSRWRMYSATLAFDCATPA